MSQLLVIGSINLDLVLETQQLPAPGETVLGGTFLRINGGKGANQAVAAARGGNINVTLIAAVGDDDFGNRVKQDYLEEPRLNASLITEKQGVSTGVAAILVDQQAENMICVAPGANAELSPTDINSLEQDLFSEAAVLLASMEVPLETIEAAICKVRGSELLVVLNPAPVVPDLLNHNLLTWVDVLTPNEHEAAQLSGVEVTDRDSAVQAGNRIREKYSIETVIITLGAAGVVVVNSAGNYAVEAPTVQAVDTTAAGDCFNGVLASQLAAGVAFQEAVSLAVRAASISVTRRGAQTSLPERQEFSV